MGFLDEISKILKIFFYISIKKYLRDWDMKKNPKKLILEPEKWKIPFLELTDLEAY